MSVSSEIARIKSAKTDIRTAIIGKGVSVPADANIDAYPAYVASIPTGIVPSGTLQIASNGTYDVASYASAQVAVPTPQPSLISKTITSNGTYSAAGDNADGYSEVTVNVSGGGDAEETLTALIDGSISSITNNASVVGAYAFYSKTQLTQASFPMATSIGQLAFSRCYHLLSLYLLGSSVATLSNINAFVSTPISNYTTSTGGVYGSIFVRASLLTAWQTATNWATYSSRFVGLTDAEIEALG